MEQLTSHTDITAVIAEDTALRAVIFMTIFSSVLLDTTFSRLVFFCDCYVSLQFYD